MQLIRVQLTTRGYNKYAWSRHPGTEMTREAETLGCNWCTWSRHFGTQLIQFLDRGTQLVIPPVLLSSCNNSDMQHHTSVTQTVWRRMTRLLAWNKLKACEKKRSWNNLYYPGTAAGRRRRYTDNLRAGRPEVRIPERFFSQKPYQPALEPTHSLPFNSRGQRGRGM